MTTANDPRPWLLDVPCPTCKAPAQVPCVGPSGQSRPRGHAARIDQHLGQLRRWTHLRLPEPS